MNDSKLFLSLSDAPEVTTLEDGVQLAPLGGGLTLSCDFDGVPMPTIEWLRNGNLLLSSDSDPHISITTDSDSSLLELTNLQRDSGGQYVCRATNVVGDGSTMVMITIMGKLYACACVRACMHLIMKFPRSSSISCNDLESCNR